MTIGEAIRAYRKENALSQIQLAEQWGVGQQTISYWETGKTFPLDENCAMIAEDLGYDLGTVLEMRFAGVTNPDRDYSRGGMKKDDVIVEQQQTITAQDKEIARLRRRLRKLEG